jgi:hypothetical protein
MSLERSVDIDFNQINAEHSNFKTTAILYI